MKVLMLMAHPDDEVIFGWPILQDKGIDKHILCVSDDRDNPERRWCAGRRDALQEVAKLVGATAHSLPFNSEFYRLPTRNADFTLSDMLQAVLDEVGKHDFDYIFTHNPDGEYGHIDHQLIHRLAVQTKHSVRFTDTFIPSNWVPYEKGRTCQPCSSGIIELDTSLYADCERIYRKHGCWTWSKPPITTCRLFDI